MNRMTQLLLVIAIAAAGCEKEQARPGTEQAGAGAPAAREAVATGGTRNADFLREQLAVGEKQVGLARLASEQAQRPAVKKFGEMVARDHQQANEELRQIASKEQMNVQPEGEQLKVERERLSKLSGEQFEAEYLDEMIADHEDAVGDLENATKVDDLEIRQWAAKTLPVVRRHLEDARQLRKTVGASQ